METYHLRWSVRDRILTKINGKSVYYAYASFNKKEEAEIWAKKHTPFWRAEVIEELFIS